MINLKIFINRKIKFNIEKSFIFNFLEMIVKLDAFTDKKINQKMKKVFIYKSFLKKFFTFQPVPKELITFKLFINREDLISIWKTFFSLTFQKK